jgi:hypothetical protein
MQCGEKDPFVDDTVIFAGRVREAKRARKTELDLAIAGKSARFGEGLRMSAAEPVDGAHLAAMKKERDQLAHETEEDWVQMVLFSEWSHGYLQMPTLMSEARAVIEDLGDWIDEAFWRFSRGWERRSEDGFTPAAAGSKSHSNSPSSKHNPGALPKSPNSPLNSETETDDSAITFVAKRFRTSPTRSAIIGGASSPKLLEESSWSEETLRDDNHAQTNSQLSRTWAIG